MTLPKKLNSDNKSSEKFWNKVHKTEQCWLWTGSIIKDTGYGQFRTFGKKGRMVKAHRYSLFLYLQNKFDQELLVLHRCDVRNCVNPAHLFQGTQKDNMEDCLRKNRYHFQSNNRK